MRDSDCMAQWTELEPVVLLKNFNVTMAFREYSEIDVSKTILEKQIHFLDHSRENDSTVYCGQTDAQPRTDRLTENIMLEAPNASH